MTIGDVLLQLVLFLAGIVAAILIPFVKKSYQKWLAGAVALILITLASGWIGYELGRSYSCRVTEYTIPVFASNYPFASTGAYIEAGDEVQVTVLGDDAAWECSTSHINDPEESDFASAEGLTGFKRAERLVPSANLCELVGYIEDGSYFRVGAHERFEAAQSGMLFLGANDDPICDSCYEDNSGSMTVEIRVSR